MLSIQLQIQGIVIHDFDSYTEKLEKDGKVSKIAVKTFEEST